MRLTKRYAAVIAAAMSFGVLAPFGASAAMSPGNIVQPKATVAALMKDESALRAVLLYHVLEGKITAAKLETMHSVKALNGQSLTVKVTGGKLMVGGATVEKANVAASNGVIHVINKVLIPR